MTRHLRKILLRYHDQKWNYSKTTFGNGKIFVKWVPGPRLTHWGRVTHICVSNLTIIGSDNSLSPDRRQAIIWTSAGLLLLGPLGANFSEILIEIPKVSFIKMRLKVSSAKWRPFCLGLNVLIPRTRPILLKESIQAMLTSRWILMAV